MPSSIRNSRWLSVGLLTLLGCGQVSPMAPRIDRLAPNQGPGNQEVPVVISGRFSVAKFDIALGEDTPRSIELPTAYLDDAPLADLKILGEGLIEVKVPKGLTAGRKEFRLVDPFGAEATAAYEVTSVDPTPVPGDPVCGDGIRAEEEACDDGNRRNGDGCNVLCQVEGGFVCPDDQACVDCLGDPSCDRCGDGSVAVGESCDDGNLVDGDGCSKDCQIEAESACARVTLRGEAVETVCAPRKEAIYVSGEMGCVSNWEDPVEPFALGTPDRPVCTLLAAKDLAEQRLNGPEYSVIRPTVLYLAPGTYEGVDFNGEDAVSNYRIYADVPLGATLPPDARAFVSIERGVNGSGYGHPLKVSNGAQVRVEGIQFRQRTSATIIDAMVVLEGVDSRLEMERVDIGPSDSVPGVLAQQGIFELRRSRVFGNAGGGVSLDSVRAAAIENSFLVGNGWMDVQSGDGSEFGGLRLNSPISGGNNLFFVHNTVAGNQARSDRRMQIDCGPVFTSKLYASLVRVTGDNRFVQPAASSTCAFAYSNVSDWIPRSEINGIDSDENFDQPVSFVDPFNPEDPDFHLQVDASKLAPRTVDWIPTSTVTNRLPPGLPSVDFDGQPRPIGAGSDVGADEVIWR